MIEILEFRPKKGGYLYGFYGDVESVAGTIEEYDNFQELPEWLRENETGTIGYIFSVEVPVKLRRKGIARNLVEKALEKMRKAEVTSVYVHASPWTGGDEFVSRLGFEPVECCEGDGGFSVWSMWL